MRGVVESGAGAIDTLGGALAHFEFEGGSLDIYDVDSMETLEEFVKTINITLTGEVKELVTKYNDYYIAVLKLKVPSVLDENSRNQLKDCPEQTQRVKQALQEKTEFNYEEIGQLIGSDPYLLREIGYLEQSAESDYYSKKRLDELYAKTDSCSIALAKLISSVTNVNSNVNGTLVNMKFQGTNEFFYPTSIVNSYKYPINDQKYFIKTPSILDIKLKSSEIDNKANFDSERWNKITSSEEDIKGEIIKAGINVRISDFLRKINQGLYNTTGWITFLIYLVIIIIPLLYYKFKVNERLTKREIGLVIVLFFIGGFILNSIVMFAKNKWKFALTLLSIWLILLLIMIIF